MTTITTKGNCRSLKKLSALSLLLFCFLLKISKSQLYEDDRIDEYNARGHTWPPPESEFIPNTPGWTELMQRRLRQVESVGGDNRYDAYMSSVYSALQAPNFTEYGWGLTRAPQDLVDELMTSLHNGLANDPPIEGGHGAVEGELRPLFIEQNELNDKAVDVLLPALESWAGVPLIGSQAYGLRVYRNESSLSMHIDRSDSHIISCILHVDHDPDSEPWPIVIEDFMGNTNEVILESGDMLLYESSKCYHGRPKSFHGSWYTSLFVHYVPEDWPVRTVMDDTHYRIPPTWSSAMPKEEGMDELLATETWLEEPNCQHNWCALENSVKWAGPGIDGKVISGGDKIVDFNEL